MNVEFNFNNDNFIFLVTEQNLTEQQQQQLLLTKQHNIPIFCLGWQGMVWQSRVKVHIQHSKGM